MSSIPNFHQLLDTIVIGTKDIYSKQPFLIPKDFFQIVTIENTTAHVLAVGFESVTFRSWKLHATNGKTVGLILSITDLE